MSELSNSNCLGLTFNMPEVIVYGLIYYLVSMIFAVTYTFTKKI